MATPLLSEQNTSSRIWHGPAERSGRRSNEPRIWLGEAVCALVCCTVRQHKLCRGQTARRRRCKDSESLRGVICVLLQLSRCQKRLVQAVFWPNSPEPALTQPSLRNLPGGARAEQDISIVEAGGASKYGSCVWESNMQEMPMDALVTALRRRGHGGRGAAHRGLPHAPEGVAQWTRRSERPAPSQGSRVSAYRSTPRARSV